LAWSALLVLGCSRPGPFIDADLARGDLIVANRDRLPGTAYVRAVEAKPGEILRLRYAPLRMTVMVAYFLHG